MSITASSCRAVALGLRCAGVAVRAALAQTDADFWPQAAYDRGDRAKLAAIAPKLGTHVLAPYVAYWQLKLGLEDASAAAVSAYIERYPGSPLADRLRSDWLKLLGRRGIWYRFAVDYQPSAGDDLELNCYAVLFRWQR
jgi:soluble lytic murein transglycosylase